MFLSIIDTCSFSNWYTLVKLLQKFGTIKKFDLLFHRSGPLEGQPRGYAFVSYISSDTAQKAKEQLNGKLIGSKNICVKWAHNMTKVHIKIYL